MNIQKIVSENRCMRCGMCFSVCPTGAISIQYNSQSGFYDPVVSDPACIDCGECVRCCPAAKDKDIHTLTGEYKAIYLAHAGNEQIRAQCTSGGVVNVLVRELIMNDIVAGVLLTGYSDKSPVESDALMITKKNVHLLSKTPRDFASRYVSVPVLFRLKEMTDSMKKIAVVGTPCQIDALTCDVRKSGNIDIFKIGIACSGAISYKATEQYKKQQGLQNAKMYYRGGGWPGKNSLVQDGRSLDYPHLGSLFERMFSSQIFKNPGCRYCKDQFAENADISVCDFWNKRERETEIVGNTCCIIRSQRAEKIFSQITKNGHIVVNRQLSEQEAVQSQINVLRAKKGNLRGKKAFRCFIWLIDFIFKKRIYVIFNLRIYRMFCSFYKKICIRSKISI